MRKTLLEYCIQFDRQDLLEQWHTEKNGELSPNTITAGSSRKVWWRCAMGHEWQSSTYSRTTQGAGCPYCTGKKLLPGNDLESLFPELAAQWHPVKNHELQPSQVSKGSRRSVWWRCENGHEWQAVVKSRTSGTGCPYCANKKNLVGENDLATTHPELAAQWHPTKNGELTPQQVVRGNVRKVWWRCSAGHEWRAQISARAMGSGCPVCSNRKIIPGVNDLASCYPVLAAQWMWEKNAPLRPDQVSVFSNKRVWWQCPLGHQWQNTIAHRAKAGSDCPVCANKVVLPGFNDLQSQMPEIAKDWHPTLNGKLTPEMVTVGSSQRAWWHCDYGHVWKAIVSSRTGKGKCGCPACAG